MKPVEPIIPGLNLAVARCAGGEVSQKKLKRYIGDGVYADFDGCNIILTVENGIRATNTIYLEPGVLDALNVALYGWLNTKIDAARDDVREEIQGCLQ